MSTYPELPIANPDEHHFYFAKDIPTDVTPEETQVYRYVRTLRDTVVSGLSLEKILRTTGEELDKLAQTGAPVTPYTWAYYPREAAVERTPAKRYEFLATTSLLLAHRVPQEFVLTALVDVIDPQTRPIITNGHRWINRYQAANTDRGFRLGDLNERQFLFGTDRATGETAEWFVDIEPILTEVE